MDLVLGAMQAFPDAAFLGVTHSFSPFLSHTTHAQVLSVRHWVQHRKLLAGSCWTPTTPGGHLPSLRLPHFSHSGLRSLRPLDPNSPRRA